MTSAFERGLAKTGATLALLAAAGLGAAGRFRPALALTVGAAVAIVSALWLSDFVGRLSGAVVGTSAAARLSWKYGLAFVLRYLVLGGAVYGGVRLFPGQVPWLLSGLSVVVAAAAVEAFRGFFRRRGAGGTETEAGAAR